MSRTSLIPRIARREDAPVLVDLWSDVLRRVDRSEQVADLELVIKGAAASPEQRFIVVEHDGQVAGSVFLRLTTVSPINLEPCVQSIQPRVFDEFRRRGVGRMLTEVAVAFAEENGVLLMTTAVPATSREANRFMARLALAPVATVRMAPTSAVRSRITPAVVAGAPRTAPRALVARRRNQRRVRGATHVPLP
ncbi:GNAT family N-acetyltransferase [Nocardioides humilatus]|uniref:GNAT family N-acetyltransferase n=1 Tax=Nocardioides humilatus TaxID=2607660 RepID=A0A5B1LCC0_9ACTN|nr:GNAT family N-acetyltransferase [Nocardioides humilatus]KAA1417868.1 GNAT family N-acetyltransferase [Nocardioides humilatus]